MSVQEVKARYVSLLETKGYEIQELGGELLCAVDKAVVRDYDNGSYNQKTMIRLLSW